MTGKPKMEVFVQTSLLHRLTGYMTEGYITIRN
jgi:hypothetical protein